MALDCDDETLPNISRFLWAKTTTPLSPQKIVACLSFIQTGLVHMDFSGEHAIWIP